MKVCFKCKAAKPPDEFYRHAKMGDGRLGKCKDCTKSDVRNNYVRNRERIREYEQMRFKSPERKAKVLVYQKRRRERHPDKYVARNAISNAVRDGRIERKPCEVCGDRKVQAHHHDYSQPLNVRWLCFKHHREVHGQVVV